MIKLLNCFKASFVIIGTIIGAGFASGQEIFSFFNVYGKNGLFGITISNLLMGIIIYKTFKIVFSKNINNYNEFIINIIPKKARKYKILEQIILNIINIFLLITFYIMAAGFASCFFQEFKIPKIIGGAILSILCIFTLLNNINGVIKINTYLIPFLILLIIFFGINQNGIKIIQEEIQGSGWFISSILYASYNSIVLIPILISLKKIVENKSKAIIVALIVAIILLILAIIIYSLISLFFYEIKTVEIPLVYIANFVNPYFKYIYGIVIMVAIFTSAISAGYSFLENVTSTNKKYKFLVFAICISAILFSQFSFSNLVSLLYPIFGYLGIAQIIFMIGA